MYKAIFDLDEIMVGDQVKFTDMMATEDASKTIAEVIEIRHILGEQTYVIETGMGERKVVNASQIRKIKSI